MCTATIHDSQRQPTTATVQPYLVKDSRKINLQAGQRTRLDFIQGCQQVRVLAPPTAGNIANKCSSNYTHSAGDQEFLCCGVHHAS